jgi:hypothetical protein
MRNDAGWIPAIAAVAALASGCAASSVAPGCGVPQSTEDCPAGCRATPLRRVAADRADCWTPDVVFVCQPEEMVFSATFGCYADGDGEVYVSGRRFDGDAIPSEWHPCTSEESARVPLPECALFPAE